MSLRSAWRSRVVFAPFAVLEESKTDLDFLKLLIGRIFFVVITTPTSLFYFCCHLLYSSYRRNRPLNAIPFIIFSFEEMLSFLSVTVLYYVLHRHPFYPLRRHTSTIHLNAVKHFVLKSFVGFSEGIIVHPLCRYPLSPIHSSPPQPFPSCL